MVKSYGYLAIRFQIHKIGHRASPPSCSVWMVQMNAGGRWTMARSLLLCLKNFELLLFGSEASGLLAMIINLIVYGLLVELMLDVLAVVIDMAMPCSREYHGRSDRGRHL